MGHFAQREVGRPAGRLANAVCCHVQLVIQGPDFPVKVARMFSLKVASITRGAIEIMRSKADPFTALQPGLFLTWVFL